LRKLRSNYRHPHKKVAFESTNFFKDFLSNKEAAFAIKVSNPGNLEKTI